MAKKKFSLNTDELETYIKSMNDVGANINQAAESSLKAVHQLLTPEIKRTYNDSKPKRKGNYRTGETESSIVTVPKVVWSGDVAKIKVGFDMNVSGMKSIWLMYGTPRIKPADTDLKNAAKGKGKYKKMYQDKMREVYNKIIERALKK